MNLQEIFMGFLTEQGLLPAQITRFFLANPGIKPDISCIADMLYSRDDFDPSLYNMPADLSQILKNKPFMADVQLSDWLKSASKILGLLKTTEIFDDIKIPEEQVKWGLTAFIQSCPFVDQTIKENYIAKIARPNFNTIQHKYFTQQPTNRDKFESYLLREYRSTTATAYVSAINQISKKYYNKLWEIETPEAFQDVLQTLFSNPEFLADNQTKHNALTSALKQFALFLDNKNNSDFQQSKLVIETSSRGGGMARQSGTTTDYDNNVVGFCFSCGHEKLFPALGQTDALEKAARILKIKPNTLKNIRDYIDRYNPYSARQGWDMPLNDVRRSVLDHYLNKSGDRYIENDKGVAEAYEDARRILRLN